MTREENAKRQEEKKKQLDDYLEWLKGGKKGNDPRKSSKHTKPPRRPNDPPTDNGFGNGGDRQ